jgi:hypothetical protein
VLYVDLLAGDMRPTSSTSSPLPSRDGQRRLSGLGIADLLSFDVASREQSGKDRQFVKLNVPHFSVQKSTQEKLFPPDGDGSRSSLLILCRKRMSERTIISVWMFRRCWLATQRQ